MGRLHEDNDEEHDLCYRVKGQMRADLEQAKTHKHQHQINTNLKSTNHMFYSVRGRLLRYAQNRSQKTKYLRFCKPSDRVANKCLLLVKQSAHANVIHVYMGLRNVSRIQETTCENHKCKHFDYEMTMSTSACTNDQRLHLRLVSLYMMWGQHLHLVSLWERKTSLLS